LTARTALAEDTETKTDLIVVSDPSPVADFAGTPLSGDAPLAVDFTDLSGGTVTAWSWDFGDGDDSTEQNPSHVFTDAGTHTVTLTATGPTGEDVEVKTDYVVAGPYALFDADPTVGAAPLEVTFTDLSVGTVTAWTWDFGDLSGDSVQNPVHTYATPGTYTVSLVVVGPGGTTRTVLTGLIEVLEPPPCAKFSATPLVGGAPLVVEFTDASIGIVEGWSWDFGDGAVSEEQHPSHEYARPGNYTVSLEVSGPGGTNRVVKSNLIQVF
jgi:PKD repeat protein